MDLASGPCELALFSLLSLADFWSLTDFESVVAVVVLSSSEASLRFARFGSFIVLENISPRLSS